MSPETRIKNEELRWNLNYLILCLLSKGFLSAFEITKLMEFIETNKNYNVFVYVFDKMYESDNNQGLEYIVKKY